MARNNHNTILFRFSANVCVYVCLSEATTTTANYSVRERTCDLVVCVPCTLCIVFIVYEWCAKRADNHKIHIKTSAEQSREFRRQFRSNIFTSHFSQGFLWSRFEFYWRRHKIDFLFHFNCHFYSPIHSLSNHGEVEKQKDGFALSREP